MASYFRWKISSELIFVETIVLSTEIPSGIIPLRIIISNGISTDLSPTDVYSTEFPTEYSVVNKHFFIVVTRRHVSHLK